MSGRTPLQVVSPAVTPRPGKQITSLGARIERRRIELELTQAEAAAQLAGVSKRRRAAQSRWSAIIRQDPRQMRLGTLLEVARVLRTSAATLLGDAIVSEPDHDRDRAWAAFVAAANGAEREDLRTLASIQFYGRRPKATTFARWLLDLQELARKAF